MNGRIYDGRLGRFLQADPFIQSPNNSQSLNRYSYVYNNPLSYTDPTGYFSLRQWVGAIVAVVGTYICGPQCGKVGYMIIGASSGAASAAANGGNILQGAVLGAFTAGAAQYGIAAAAFAGGTASYIQGGKFGRGFVSAGVGATAGGGQGQGMTKVITAALVGGSISKITGGKFANGAATAAFYAAVSADWSNKPTSDTLPKPNFDSMSNQEFADWVLENAEVLGIQVREGSNC